MTIYILGVLTIIVPLWRIPTVELADQMLAAGLQAYIGSVDLTKLPASLRAVNGHSTC